MLSIVIPVYRNAESIPDLLAALSNIANITQRDFNQATEVVFVVDGSPDNCHDLLKQHYLLLHLLPSCCYIRAILALLRQYAQG